MTLIIDLRSSGQLRNGPQFFAQSRLSLLPESPCTVVTADHYALNGRRGINIPGVYGVSTADEF